MTRYDVVVLGLTRAGAAVADAAAAAGKKVAVVRFPDSDDYADHLCYALEEAPRPPEGPVRFEILTGPAAFISSGTLSVGGADISAPRFVLTPGARPRFPDGLDGVPLSTPLEVLSALPGRRLNAVVLGGGPVAVVVAERLRAAGGAVTIAARSPRLLMREDEIISDVLAGHLRARGIAINLGISGLAVSPRDGGRHVRFCCGGDNREAQVDVIVAATGVAPALEGLALDKAGVLLHDGRVVVNDEMQTSNPRIYAAGHSVEPGAALAVQDHQAEIASANLTAPFWARRRMEPGESPFCLRSATPVARVGLTEGQARKKYRDVVVSMAPYFEPHGSEGAPGMIKLVGRRRHARLLGAHVVGLGAAELILFFDLLVRSEIAIPDVPDRRHFPLPGPSDAAFRALTAWAAAG